MRELLIAFVVGMIRDGVRTLASIPTGEDELASRLVSQEPDAFAELYDRHGRSVYSLALRIVGEPAEAEDVVQDVFGQAWRQAARFNPRRGPLVAWLLNITRTRAIDHLRSKRRLVTMSVDELDAMRAPGPAVDAAMLARVDAGALRTALEALPAAQRVPIELAYFEGLSQSEIAERLGEPLGTIKTRVRLGLSKLREAVTGTRR